MIFGAKWMSFKTLVVVLGLIGATWVADCQADRNPLSPVKHNQFQALVDAKAPQFEAFKRDCKRNEKRWNEIGRFVGQQVVAASDKLASSAVSNWWAERVLSRKKALVRQQVGKDSIAISPASLLVKLAGNLSAIQWWQVASQITGSFESAHERVVQTSAQFQVEFRNSLLQLAKTGSSLVEQKVNDLAASSFVQGFFAGTSVRVASKSEQVIENVNEVTSADAYWSYYSDCDFWGVEFNPADEE